MVVEFIGEVKHSLPAFIIGMAFLVLMTPCLYAQQVFTEQGVSIEFSVASKAVAGEEATVQFKITGTSGSVPLTNLRPVSWIDLRQSPQAPTARECREKVQSFLQPTFTKRPTIDLNAYFVLALNNEPNISVIDPLSGFGGSSAIFVPRARKPPLQPSLRRVY